MNNEKLMTVLLSHESLRKSQWLVKHIINMFLKLLRMRAKPEIKKLLNLCSMVLK